MHGEEGDATYFATLSSAEAGGKFPPDLDKLATQRGEYIVMEQDMPRSDVLVVGAGPTGLILALWLTKLGVKLRIIDKTAEPGTTSRAVTRSQPFGSGSRANPRRAFLSRRSARI